jgi:hypothetical protein
MLNINLHKLMSLSGRIACGREAVLGAYPPVHCASLPRAEYIIYAS